MNRKIDTGVQYSNIWHLVGGPKFNSGFDEREYRYHVSASNSNLLPRDLTISLKIPNFGQVQTISPNSQELGYEDSKDVSERDRNAYVDQLLREIALQGNLFEKDRRVTQINFGGNFSNVLVEPQGAEILDEIAAQFHLDLPSKLTLCHKISHSRNSASLVSRLVASGFNRFNICTKELLQNQQRTKPSHAVSHFIEAILTAQEKAASVEIDFCVDSHPSRADLQGSVLAKLLELGVSQINLIDAAGSVRAKPLTMMRDALKSAGYIQLGLDQFGAPNSELTTAYQKGNVYCDISGKLTTRNTDYVGIGLGSISQLNTAYAKNLSESFDYSESLDQNLLPIEKGVSLSPDHQLRVAMVKEVICKSRIDLDRTTGRYIDLPTSTTIREYFSLELKALVSLAKQELINISKFGFEITPKGMDQKLRIAAIFDAQINSNKNNEPVSIFKTANK